ncbi:ATP-dependent DNA helicase RecG [bacterium A37T11]|nr:ATP-dependent DNA helicase RecG [bacterium A37T11]
MYVYNSGGPDRSVRREDFVSGRVLPQHYRNRRLGSFLKELDLTEAYASGIRLIIREMQQNGSPEPIFDFDDERTWFSVMLPIHPDFVREEISGRSENRSENRSKNRSENLLEGLSQNQLKIIEAMRVDKKITHKELSLIVGLAESNVASNIKKLIALNALSRVGPARGGYWQVNI